MWSSYSKGWKGNDSLTRKVKRNVHGEIKLVAYHDTEGGKQEY